MRPILIALALAVLPLAASGCGDSPTSIEDTRFAAGLGVDLDSMTRTASGMYYRDLTVGTGTVAQSGKTVGVYYKGSLPNGRVFDSLSSGTPFSFKLGTGAVIPGFDEGITGMKVGGKRLMVIPPALGYGNQPAGSIPANSILVFEVTLVSVQ
ncbi:MAG TPA: FKBP-type peptidyl-prolyl cis-trans isomerase [Longimicrobium sp.]|jgi:FKBP-type peptidyl-prolyl cis-trans isomerase|uniref:FKBP-type peptidyl-prolyl cis-trans isomerase n=1 Tax=Longimicrobium sp. TaxID=2029185 RepID=UPI002ED7F5EA